MPWRNSPDDRARSNAAYGPQYRRNRPIVMRRDRWRCQLRIPGVCVGAASTCDHIRAVADGGDSSVENMRAACDPCHKKRTAEQGGGFRAGPKADPDPSPRTAW